MLTEEELLEKNYKHAIRFIKKRIEEECEKEHNFRYEFESVLFYLDKEYQCSECVFNKFKNYTAFRLECPAQCDRCSARYGLLYRKEIK